MIFNENRLLADDSHEISYLIFFWKLGKMLLNLSSVAVVIGALRAKYQFNPGECPGVPVYLAPWTACPPGASCPGISCPPPWLSSPPGGKLSRPVYLAPLPTQVKYTHVILLFFCIILMNSDPP